MTQEDKELLLRDLCGRLPYGVKIQESILWYEEGKEVWKYRDIDLSINNINCINIDFIKPYLFPLSSMTEEQKKEFKEISKCEYEIRDYGGYDSEGVYLIEIGQYEYEHDIDTTVEQFYFNAEIIDWLNRNNFDYRGLIPMDLAKDATGKNIY